MAPTLQELGLHRLATEDRLAVAEALWESVALEVASSPIPPAQLAELKRRLADSVSRPDAVVPWPEVWALATA